MKIASFGWEADQIYQDTVRVVFPVLNDITIRGYQLDVGMMLWKAPGLIQFRWPPFPVPQWFEVLFTLGIDPVVNVDFGKPAFSDPGKQNLHGFPMDGSLLARAILKGFDTQATNKSIVATGLSIAVPAGSNIAMAAGHAGFGPLDFEVQGALYYE